MLFSSGSKPHAASRLFRDSRLHCSPLFKNIQAANFSTGFPIIESKYQGPNGLFTLANCFFFSFLKGRLFLFCFSMRIQRGEHLQKTKTKWDQWLLHPRLQSLGTCVVNVTRKSLPISCACLEEERRLMRTGGSQSMPKSRATSACCTRKERRNADACISYRHSAKWYNEVCKFNQSNFASLPAI